MIEGKNSFFVITDNKLAHPQVKKMNSNMYIHGCTIHANTKIKKLMSQKYVIVSFHC